MSLLLGGGNILKLRIFYTPKEEFISTEVFEMNKSYVLLTVLLLGILLVACNLATNSEGGTLSPEQEILKAEGKGTDTAC